MLPSADGTPDQSLAGGARLRVSEERAEADAVATGRSRPQARSEDAPASRDRARPEARSADLFRGLGAWLDQFDYDALRPSRVIPTLRRNGVRTLYLQTGYSTYRTVIDPRVGPWLRAAHDAGIDVVGWYLPSYRRPAVDRARTIAIARYRYRGHGFDGIGLDIENKKAVTSNRKWNQRVRIHALAVRKGVPDTMPIAAIVPPPLQMRVAPGHWAGFPWHSLARATDAFLLMSYWSDRSGCPHVRRHCPYEFTAQNVTLTRSLAKKPDALVHIIGGIGDRISAAELADFAIAASRAGANGASIYDVATTKPVFWRVLRELRTLR